MPRRHSRRRLEFLHFCLCAGLDVERAVMRATPAVLPALGDRRGRARPGIILRPGRQTRPHGVVFDVPHDPPSLQLAADPMIVGLRLPEGLSRAAQHPVGLSRCVAFQAPGELGDRGSRWAPFEATTGQCGRCPESDPSRGRLCLPRTTTAVEHMGQVRMPGKFSLSAGETAGMAGCAGHVQQLGSGSLLPNRMEVKG